MDQDDRTLTDPREILQNSVFSAYQLALELGDARTAEALLGILGQAGQGLPAEPPNVQRLAPPRAAA